MNIILVIKDNVSINKIACMFFVILSGVGVTILYFNDPRIAKFYPLCIFRVVTGCNCPGCGGLRATYCLLHGDFISALKYNPLLVISLPFIFFLVITKNKRFGPWLPWTVFGILVSYALLRNIPCWPFIILSPPPIPN